MEGKREKEDPPGRGESRCSHVMHGRRGGGWCGKGGRALPWRLTSHDQSGELQRVDFFFLSVLATPEPLEVIRQVFLERQKPSSWISQKGGGRD